MIAHQNLNDGRPCWLSTLTMKEVASQLKQKGFKKQVGSFSISATKAGFVNRRNVWLAVKLNDSGIQWFRYNRVGDEHFSDSGNTLESLLNVALI